MITSVLPVFQQNQKDKLFSPKDIIEFSGDYSIVINPASRQIIKENRGGNFVLTKINGETMDYESKIMIQ